MCRYLVHGVRTNVTAAATTSPYVSLLLLLLLVVAVIRKILFVRTAVQDILSGVLCSVYIIRKTAFPRCHDQLLYAWPKLVTGRLLGGYRWFTKNSQCRIPSNALGAERERQQSRGDMKRPTAMHVIPAFLVFVLEAILVSAFTVTQQQQYARSAVVFRKT